MLDIFAKKTPFNNLNFHGLEFILIAGAIVLSWVLVLIHLRRKNNLPPGPAGLPIVGYVPFMGREPHKTFKRLSKKYGDIICVHLGSQLTIILNEYNVAKEAITHPSSLDRAPNIFENLKHSGFLSANGKEWIEQRRFCLSAIRSLGLGRGPWEKLIVEEVKSFIDQLRASKGSPVELNHSLSSSISSNIISLLFGHRLDKDKDADKIQLANNYSHLALTYTGPSNVATIMPWIRTFFEVFHIAGYDVAKKVIDHFSQFVRSEIIKRKVSPGSYDSPDFIKYYKEKMAEVYPSQKIKNYFTDENLEGNLNGLFLGASDTVFCSMGWLLRLMAQHQDVQQKVFSELVEVLGKNGEARYDERDKIPYTFAVMMESQRFSSIVPLSTTRMVNSDFTLRGYTIPKGAAIVANLWALHNDPIYWEEPEVFKPERFLTNNGTTLIKNPPSYTPFSTGRRNCPGETIAWMEILTYFTEIVKKFEISTPQGVKPKFEIINGIVARLEEQPLCFKERKLDY